MTASIPAASSPACSPPPYSDTQAMDDIQALLTSPGRPEGEAAIDAVAEIIQRTRRSMATPRLMTLNQGTGTSGLPYAFIDAEGTVIRVSQDPDTGALRVTITAMNRLDEQGLRVDVDGQQLVPALHDADGTGAGRGNSSAADPPEGGAW